MNKDGFISTFYSLLYHYCFLVRSVIETLGLHVLGKAPVGSQTMHCVTSSSSVSAADPELSSLPLPALLFLPSADNSGHDNDTESVSEPTSGCSNLSLSLPLRVHSCPQCPTALTASSSHRVG